MNGAALTIVIPTYNHLALLRRCLESLRRQTRAADRIVVVDDGSTEDIAGAMASEFPEVAVVRLDRNGGFCRAANAGLRAAETPYVFLLNNDMTLDADCIELLMGRADSGAILTPLVVFEKDPEFMYSAGDRVLTNGRPEAIGFRERREGFVFPARVFGATGGAMLVPRPVFDRIGHFDETFVAYFEDADLCMRARWAGFECAPVTNAIARHVGSASLGGKTWWRSRQCFRNHGLLVLKNFPVAVALRFFPAILRERWRQARMVVSSARTEFGLVRALGVLVGAAASLAAAAPYALAARTHLRRRAITNAEFVSLLTRSADRR